MRHTPLPTFGPSQLLLSQRITQLTKYTDKTYISAGVVKPPNLTFRLRNTLTRRVEPVEPRSLDEVPD